MRCFIAIELDSETRGILSEAQKVLLDLGVKGNFTRPDNLHLTLKFLGEIDDSVFDRTSKLIKNIAAKYQAFVLTMDKFGKFDRGNRKIIWAGLHKSTELEALYEDIDTGITEIMPIAREKYYTPHITLAREALLTDGALNNSLIIDKLKHSFYASGISLMESTRENGKLVYLRRILCNF